MKKLKEKYNALITRLSVTKKLRHTPLYRTFVLVMIAVIASSHTIPAHAAMVQVSEETDFNDTQHAYFMQGDPHTSEGGNLVNWHTGGWYALKVGGQYVFCIEPWKSVFSGTSVSESDLYYMLNNDSKLSKKLSQIGYYGYWDTAQTRADYITTQLMIWEARGWTVTTAPSYYAEKKAAIQSKMDRSAKQLSFSGTTKTVKVNETVSFTDTNGVLADYMKGAGYPNQNTNYTKDGVTLKWSGNTLYLIPTVDASEKTS